MGNKMYVRIEKAKGGKYCVKAVAVVGNNKQNLTSPVVSKQKAEAGVALLVAYGCVEGKPKE